MNKMGWIKSAEPPPRKLGTSAWWRKNIQRGVICVIILAVMPLYPAPQPALAGGIGGRVAKAIPFAGVVIGWGQRNRVYRTSERFIRDRNQYYEGLLAMAR